MKQNSYKQYMLDYNESKKYTILEMVILNLYKDDLNGNRRMTLSQQGKKYWTRLQIR